MSTADDSPSLPENAAAPDSFIEKWLVRWPEWSVAQVFVPQAQRPTLLAWAALQQELGDAAWGGSDARPGEAKLGWWQEELRGWSRGLRRHPLGAMLQAQPGDWLALASVLPALRDSRERPADAADALRQLAMVAEVLARIDAGLEAGAMPGEAPGIPLGFATALVSQQLLHARLLVAGETAVPLQELARAGQGNAALLWAQQVPALAFEVHGPGHAMPEDQGTRGMTRSAQAPVPRFRRVTAALARQRLRQGDVARPLPAWRALVAAWQGARN
ncbi:phytoene/squalene synthase family protein [Lysobacter olei]